MKTPRQLRIENSIRGLGEQYKLDPLQWIEWTYIRPQGDISVFAPTAEEAVRTMNEHGFMNIDSKMLRKTDKFLCDVLKDPLT